MPYGVSEQMIETWGEMIFDLSLNIQIRRGDPIRHLDFDAWLGMREDMGLTDPEIASKLGLATEQVTFIRNITERRRFRLNQYRKLYRLGGGLRYREGRYQDPEEKFEMGDAAVLLRQAINVPAQDAARYIRDGLWTQARIPDYLDEHAAARADAVALTDQNKSLTWAELHNRCHRLAASLQSKGLRRGDIVVANLPAGINQVVAYLAILICGAVFLPLPPQTNGAMLAAWLKRAGAKAAILGSAQAHPTLAGELASLAKQSGSLDLVIQDNETRSDDVHSLIEMMDGHDDNPHTGGAAGLAATDPALLLIADDNADNLTTLAIHSHQSLVSGAASVEAEIAGETEIAGDPARPLASQLSLTTGAGSLVLHLALRTGRTLQFSQPSRPDMALVATCANHVITIARSGAGDIQIMSTNQISAAMINTGIIGDGATWKPSIGSQARIVNEYGTSLLDGQPGHLQLLGPGQCVGYTDGPTNRTIDGWLRTNHHATMSGTDIQKMNDSPKTKV
ncbi:MAG: acyl--CoA ligase [Alphaproteobacteria bacterium]|nr:acyl--CoA ligase [Alphaproteobacteria bacterium]